MDATKSGYKPASRPRPSLPRRVHGAACTGLCAPTGLFGGYRYTASEFYRDTPNGPQPVRSVGSVVDVTHLKETEDALRENELRLRLALDAAQMGTFEADIAAEKVMMDAHQSLLFGWPENPRVVSIAELRKRVPLEDLAISDAKQKRLSEVGEPYHHEFRFHMPDGSERWLSAFANIRSNRIVGVSFDVSERKRAEHCAT